ncbi:MAG: hypothetical protein SPH44_10015 [Eubacteriales bacterium]|nr:hypothetical protein [Eubacteriales bacterium]
MKYCPFCGAVLPDEKISFCLECGEKLSDLNLHTETEKPVKKPTKKEKKPKCKKKRKPDAELFSEEPTESVSDNYDGYYDDVTPKDSVMLHQGLDKTMVKKLVILIGCVIIAIALCVVALVLLS